MVGVCAWEVWDRRARFARVFSLRARVARGLRGETLRGSTRLRLERFRNLSRSAEPL
jgi:hypothetical protein